MASELELLIRQKHDIEERIKMLRNEGITRFGIAKIDKEHYPTSRPDEWYVAVKTIQIGIDTRSIWKSIIRSTDRDAVINAIESVITSLTQLQRELKGDSDETQKEK